MTEPLKADKRRQAMPAIRGYVYQIWRSLFAWIRLKEDEVLYLEGAEDFEKVSSEIVSATQVKYVSGTLSLGGAEAREAIDNYLALRERNPDRVVQYRYLTTAAARVERNHPFGQDTPGIEFWEHCRQTGRGVEEIQGFLLQSKSLSPRVQRFLTKCSSKEILDQLVRPFTWEVETVEQKDVERYILEQLINRGDKHDILPDESKRVVDTLLRVTFETATRESDRSLTRAQFLELFQEATMARVPRSYVRMFSKFEGTSIGPYSNADLVATWTRREPPPSAEDLLERESVVAELSTTLFNHGTLVLTGTTGMGKTTLAKQIVGKAENLLWVSMSSIPAGSRGQVARIVSLFAPSVISPGSMVVLDDVQHDWYSNELYDVLADVFIVSLECNALVIVTCHKFPPKRFARVAGLNPASERAVPPLSREEIQRFGERLGCTSRHVHDWSGVIEMHTSGHPQLVHAHLIALREGTWPTGSREEVLQPPDEVQEERQNVRQALTSTLKEEPLRFLYYLSFVTSGFRRDHAMRIGEQLAGIEMPGLALDTLMGPWIEQLLRGYFKVSPLLVGAYREVFSEDRVVDSHKVIAEVFGSAKGASIFEASTALMHSFPGRNADTMARVSMGLLQSWTDKSVSNIASFLSWIVAIDIEGESATWYRAEAIVFFRMLQFRVASLKAPEYCDRIIKRWDTECNSIAEPKVRSANRLFFCLEILTFPDGRASLKRTLPYFVEMMDMKYLTPTESGISSILGDISIPAEYMILENEYPGGMVFFEIMQRVETVSDLDSVLQFLDTVEGKMRIRILAAMEDDVLDPIFVNNPWVGESKKEKPDWEPIKDQLRRTMRLAESWDSMSIYREAGLALATIEADYFEDFGRAYEILELLEKHCGRAPSLLGRRAAILCDEKRYGEALELWREVFRLRRPHPLCPKILHEVSFVLSRRTAAIAASELGEWTESIGLFLDACNWAYVMGDASYQAALKADAALVAYLNGDAEQTVNLLFEVLTELDALDKTEPDSNVHTTRRRVSYLILWIHEGLRGALKNGKSLDKPWIGFCSNTERVDDIKRMSLFAIDIGYAYLSTIEEDLLHRSDIFSRVSGHLFSSSSESVRFSMSHLDVQKAFRRCRFDQLIERMARMVNEGKRPMGRIIELKKQGLQDSDLRRVLEEVEKDRGRYRPIDPGIDFLIGALIAIRLRRPDEEDRLFRTWKEALARVESWPELPYMLALAEDSRTWSLSVSISILTSTEEEPNRRLFAAVAIGTGLDSQVEAQFYAHSILFSSLSQSLWKEDVADYLAELFQRQWLRFAATPALLRMPQLSVPGIFAACESSATGLKKAAKILLAALLAVSARLPSEAVESLKKIAEETV